MRVEERTRCEAASFFVIAALRIATASDRESVLSDAQEMRLRMEWHWRMAYLIIFILVDCVGAMIPHIVVLQYALFFNTALTGEQASEIECLFLTRNIGKHTECQRKRVRRIKKKSRICNIEHLWSLNDTDDSSVRARYPACLREIWRCWPTRAHVADADLQRSRVGDRRCPVPD